MSATGYDHSLAEASYRSDDSRLPSEKRQTSSNRELDEQVPVRTLSQRQQQARPRGRNRLAESRVFG